MAGGMGTGGPPEHGHGQRTSKVGVWKELAERNAQLSAKPPKHALRPELANAGPDGIVHGAGSGKIMGWLVAIIVLGLVVWGIYALLT